MLLRKKWNLRAHNAWSLFQPQLFLMRPTSRRRAATVQKRGLANRNNQTNTLLYCECMHSFFYFHVVSSTSFSSKLVSSFSSFTLFMVIIYCCWTGVKWHSWFIYLFCSSHSFLPPLLLLLCIFSAHSLIFLK